MKKFLALNLSDVVFIKLLNVGNCWHLNIHEQDKFRAQLSWAWKKSFINSSPEPLLLAYSKYEGRWRLRPQFIPLNMLETLPWAFKVCIYAKLPKSHDRPSDKQKFWRKIVIIFLSISSNVCFGCSKEPSHWDRSFEHLKHMYWLRNKKMKRNKKIVNIFF